MMNKIESINQKLRLYNHNHKIILANVTDVDISLLAYSTYTLQLI